MKWCPICRVEYRDDFEVCADCGGALEEKGPEEIQPQKPGLKAMQPRLVYSTCNRLDAEMRQAFLDNAGIQVFFKETGMGNSAQIYMGYASGDFYLYVDEKDCLAAKELLEIYLSQNEFAPSDEEAAENLLVAEDDSEGYNAGDRKWFWLKIIIGAMVAINLIVFIFGNLTL